MNIDDPTFVFSCVLCDGPAAPTDKTWFVKDTDMQVFACTACVAKTESGSNPVDLILAALTAGASEVP